MRNQKKNTFRKRVQSMVFNFEAANTAMKVYTGGDVRALIFIMYSAGAFGKIFICLFANHSGFTGAMIGGPIMNDFFVVFIGAAIQRDLTGDKAYSNLFLAASILYMYASTLYVFENREDIVKALVVILTLAAAFARVASENVNNGEFKAHNFFLFCQFLGTSKFDFFSTFEQTRMNHQQYIYKVLELQHFIVHTSTSTKNTIALCISMRAAL